MIRIKDNFAFSIDQRMVTCYKIKISALSALLCASSLFSVSSIADDTDVFFAEDIDSELTTANVMFMFDTSGSMEYTEEDVTPRATTPRPDTRMYRLKKAMMQVLESVENVNIGIGAFNGSRQGGAIRFPVVGIDEDMCPEGCETVRVLSKIESNEDDAQQNDSGDVELYNDTMRISDPSNLDERSDASLMALRFTDLNIPRGADITKAQLRMVSPRTGQRNDSLLISAERADNSEPFSGNNGELSDRWRDRTDEEISWPLEEWVNQDKPGLSADIQSVVEEITSRDGWCGGNALTLLLTGEDNKIIYTHDHDQWLAPMLIVEYDPSSVSADDTCLRTTVSSGIATGNDDVSVDIGEGTTSVSDTILTTRNGTNLQRLGLRFDSVDVPAGVEVSSAYIELTSKGYTDGVVNLTINAEGSAEEISGSIDYPLVSNSRTYVGGDVEWSVPEEDSGIAVKSPDLKSLVEQVVSSDSWTTGSSVLFTLTPSTGGGIRDFAAYESPTSSARLVVKYQQDEDDLDGTLPVLITGREQLIDTMLQLRPEGNTPFVDYFYEAAQYMLGREVDFGRQRGSQRDNDRYHRLSVASSYTGEANIDTPEGCTDLNPFAASCKDEVMQGTPTYIKPTATECNANHIILLSDGEPTVNSSQGRVSALIGGSCARDEDDEEGDGVCAVELAEWLAHPDRFGDANTRNPVITNTIGMNINSELLETIASEDNGNGTFYPVSSSADINEAFSAIVQAAASSDTTFVAPSTSVSLQNRLVNSNDVYYAMFSPDTSTVWDGNLKRYAFKENTTSGQLEIVDSDDLAILDDDGAIVDNAKSFWSGATDGAAVELGGAASKQTLPRNVYVSLNSEAVLQTLTDTNNAITKDLLGIEGATDEYRELLLKWAKGEDVNDRDGDGDYEDVRTQMGDPLHSTQQIFTYAVDDEEESTEESEEVETQTRIFVGTNQGFLHAIDVSDGTEEFAFIPEELLGNLDYYYKDNPIDNNERPYGLDGEVTGWHNDLNDNGIVDGSDTAYLYVGMRRGGRNYYALDVTDPSGPPELLWTIKGGFTPFEELGQTWSRPVKAKVNYLGDDKDVLFFAAGYDPGNDDDATRLADDYGRGLFMVNASTGAYIASLEKDEDNIDAMNFSIPSDIRVINPDGDEYSNSIFVGDTGGQLWRFDINNSTDTESKFLTGAVLANISGTDAADNRQFFHEPDVSIISSVPGASFLNIAIGSGTRPDPNDLIVENGFYSIRDTNIYQAPVDEDGDVDYSDALDEGDLVNVTTSLGSESSSENISNGWFFRMTHEGEKVLSTALTLNNQLFFTSYSPLTEVEDPCAAQIGGGYVYTLDVVYGDPSNGSTDLDERYTLLLVPGIPPPVSGTITEAMPDTVSTFVGFEKLDQDSTSDPFKKSFWAEQ